MLPYDHHIPFPVSMQIEPINFLRNHLDAVFGASLQIQDSIVQRIWVVFELSKGNVTVVTNDPALH